MNDLRSIPEKHACIHTVVLNDYQPEMCKLTIPNLKAYADRIGADFNIIDKAIFDGYPPIFEEFQVYELGKDYKYNMVLNADIILHKDVPDFTKNFDLNFVGYLGTIDVAYCFKPNYYFKRSRIKRGLSDAMVVSTYVTHDVWTPPKYTYNEIREECLLYEVQIGEFWLSVNLARFGLTLAPIFTRKPTMYHVGTAYNKEGKPEDLIRQNLKLWESLGG
jgi:hypothetical protein